MQLDGQSAPLIRAKFQVAVLDSPSVGVQLSWQSIAFAQQVSAVRFRLPPSFLFKSQKFKGQVVQELAVNALVFISDLMNVLFYIEIIYTTTWQAPKCSCTATTTYRTCRRKVITVTILKIFGKISRCLPAPVGLPRSSNPLKNA